MQPGIKIIKFLDYKPTPLGIYLNILHLEICNDRLTGTPNIIEILIIHEQRYRLF